ncbi:M14 family zinc carboxypeptidase [Robiginitalea sp.]|nr:M14 family zinc carboxypeptidase [Robiginitalea sp.]
MNSNELAAWHKKSKIKGLDSRFFPIEALEKVLKSHFATLKPNKIGVSAAGRPIYSLKLGDGNTRVLLWSQMHGNESTTTRSILDTLYFLRSNNPLGSELLSSLSIYLIPILNPDGAGLFTRVNNNQVDLNRDATSLSQPESRLLREVFLDFKPHYCFNLHDQRSIFGVGLSGVPATLSFLAPAANAELEITSNRKRAMQIISGVRQALNPILGGGIGRFSDEFNPNCVGDQFQMHNIPTILFEAGHYAFDYTRNSTREFLFVAFIEALRLIAETNYQEFSLEGYFNIPENTKSFTDLHVYNPHILNARFSPKSVVKLFFEEQLVKKSVIQRPVLLNETISSGQFAHKILDASKIEDLEWMKSDPILSNYFE